jgi:hypothetical protein
MPVAASARAHRQIQNVGGAGYATSMRVRAAACRRVLATGRLASSTRSWTATGEWPAHSRPSYLPVPTSASRNSAASKSGSAPTLRTTTASSPTPHDPGSPTRDAKTAPRPVPVDARKTRRAGLIGKRHRFSHPAAPSATAEAVFGCTLVMGNNACAIVLGRKPRGG